MELRYNLELKDFSTLKQDQFTKGLKKCKKRVLFKNYKIFHDFSQANQNMTETINLPHSNTENTQLYGTKYNLIELPENNTIKISKT
ncbi:unnamed protein product [Gordionus sp. m RMFG-2023]